MTMWVVVVVAGVLTYAMRLSFIALFGRVAIPPQVERGLQYIAPAVLAAITLPAILAPGGTMDPWNVFLPAGVIGGLAAWRTRSIGAAIIVGLPTLWILQWLVG